MMFIPIIGALVVLLAVAAVLLSDKGRGFTDFFRLVITGLESGFSLRQIFLLSKIGKASGLEDSSTLFWSSSALDRCTAEIVRQSKRAGSENERKTQDLLAALYAYRGKMDLEQSRKRRGITTTRDIGVGQPLSIIFSGAGIFSSKVAENSRGCLTIDFPRSSSVMATEIDWNNKPLKVYFWRTDDAGYEFHTKVIPHGHGGDSRAVLRLEHSDKVVRTQLRKSRRKKCSIPAHLYILKSDESAMEVEAEAGMKCVLQDLSETGAMILVGGRATRGMKIKIQFMLQDKLIVMAGAVKAVKQDTAKRASRINFECDLISPEMKNEVLAFVYNVMTEPKKYANGGFMPNASSPKTSAANDESSPIGQNAFLPQDNPLAQDDLPDFAAERHD